MFYFYLTGKLSKESLDSYLVKYTVNAFEYKCKILLKE